MTTLLYNDTHSSIWTSPSLLTHKHTRTNKLRAVRDHFSNSSVSQTNVTAEENKYVLCACLHTLSWTITRIIRRTVFGVPRKHHLCVHSLLSLTFTISLLLSSCLRPRSGFLCARRPVLICQTTPTKRDTFKSVQTCPRRFQMCLMRSPYRVEVKGRLEMGSVVFRAQQNKLPLILKVEGNGQTLEGKKERVSDCISNFASVSKRFHHNYFYVLSAADEWPSPILASAFYRHRSGFASRLRKDLLSANQDTF